MSFEDDEYWDDEYHDRSGIAPSAARGDFDMSRPGWLDRPDFLATDTSPTDPEFEVVDFNRPEFGADFDNPEFPATGRAAPRSSESRQRRGARLPPDDDFNHRDPAYDHAGGMARFRGDLTPVLEAIRWRLDGGTLREVVDDPAALRDLGVRLDRPLARTQDHLTRSGLLSVRAKVHRLLGELGRAATAGRLALAHAESARDVPAIVIAQAELAHVLRLRGEFAEADRLFEEAAGSEAGEVLRSVVHENAGRSCFDQGRHMEALDHFGRAVQLGRPDDTDLIERVGVCLQAVYLHVLRDGWGPYPRLRREILGPAGNVIRCATRRPGRAVRPAEPAPRRR